MKHSNQSPRFGELLKLAVKRISFHQHKGIGEVQKKLGEEIYKSWESIRGYSRGRIPPESESVRKMAYWLVRNGGLLTADELRRFLSSARYQNNIDDLVEELSESFSRAANLYNPIGNRLVKQKDWRDAPDVVEILYGRKRELARLRRWIVTDRCRSVGIYGAEGIGKTALTRSLVDEVEDDFEYGLWVRLTDLPPIDRVLAACIQHFSDQRDEGQDLSPSEQIVHLLSLFQSRRCLLVFDAFDSVFEEGALADHYRDGCDDFGSLIYRAATGAHQSCVLITSSHVLKEIIPETGRKSRVRELTVQGLELDPGRNLLVGKRLFGSKENWLKLIRRYDGNPGFLKIVSGDISGLYAGNIAEFLEVPETIIPRGIRTRFEVRLRQVTKTERDILFWMTIARKAVSFADLRANYYGRFLSDEELHDTLQSLQWRSLIEKATTGFVLQDLLNTYLTNRLLEQVAREIETNELALLNSHALLNARAPHYVQERQERIILDPILQTLRDAGNDDVVIENLLNKILLSLRQKSARSQGYAGANLIHLFHRLGADVGGRDFSGSFIRDANLQSIHLVNTNFTDAAFANATFAETFGRILSVDTSLAGGQLRLAAGTSDSEIRLWIISPLGEMLKSETYKGTLGWVWSVTFSPDGHILASGGEDKTIKLWDIYEGLCIGTLAGHKDWIRSVAFSPDGKLVASGSKDCFVKVWDIETRQCRQTLLGHEAEVRTIAFAPSGMILASAGDDNAVILWDIFSGETVGRLDAHTDDVNAIAFSPEGGVLASAGDDNSIRIWDTASLKELSNLTGHLNGIRSIAFSPDGSVLASCGDDFSVRLWDLKTGTCIDSMLGHKARVRSVSFISGSDNRWLVTGSEDRTLRLWDIETGSCSALLQGFANPAWFAIFDPEGKTIFSGHDDGTLRVWDSYNGHALEKHQEHSDAIWSVALSKKSKLLATSSEDNTVRLWDVRTRKSELLGTHSGYINYVVFSPGGQMMASCSDDATVKIWDIQRKECLRTLKHTGTVWCADYHPNKSILATAGTDNKILVWHAETGALIALLEIPTSPETFINHIWCLQFSPDGSVLASGSDDGVVRLWDTNEWKCVHNLTKHSNTIGFLAFSQDGLTLATGGRDGLIWLWDMQSKNPTKSFHGHEAQIWSVEFSPDDRALVSASEDGTIRIWDTQTGKRRQILRASRPYEGMVIKGATGLSKPQIDSLIKLGARI